MPGSVPRGGRSAKLVGASEILSVLLWLRISHPRYSEWDLASGRPRMLRPGLSLASSSTSLFSPSFSLRIASVARRLYSQHATPVRRRWSLRARPRTSTSARSRPSCRRRPRDKQEGLARARERRQGPQQSGSRSRRSRRRSSKSGGSSSAGEHRGAQCPSLGTHHDSDGHFITRACDRCR